MSDARTVTVEALTADDWQRFRDIRLAALRDTPRAFGSTLERELGFDEDDWKLRAATSAVAVRDDRDVGLVGWHDSSEDPDDTLHLVAMWVHPEARGSGAARPLVEWVLDVARAMPGKDRVALWVATWNEPAERFYRRCGFERTGRQGPLPSFPDVLENEMVCDLRPRPADGVRGTASR